MVSWWMGCILFAFHYWFPVSGSKPSVSPLSIGSDCKAKLHHCETAFQSELQRIKFGQAQAHHDQIYSDVCRQKGLYDRYMSCVQQTLTIGQCSHLTGTRLTSNRELKRELCEGRTIKLASYRYTWKVNLIHDVCFRTSSVLDGGKFWLHAAPDMLIQ